MPLPRPDPFFMQALSAPPPPLAHAAELHGNFIMLRADSLRLVVAQQSVVSTEYLASKPVAFGTEHGLLHIPEANDDAVYVAISPEMRLLQACPPDRFVATQLEGLDVRWCWSEVRVLMDVHLHLHPLAEALLTPFTPVRQMVALGESWAFVCTAQALQAFVLSQKG